MFWGSDGWPEAIPAADGAVAAVGVLREVKVRLEADRTAMAATFIRLQHTFGSSAGQRFGERRANTMLSDGTALVARPFH